VLRNTFTLLGALAGAQLSGPGTWGLDGAAVAAFLGLLWPRLKGRDPVATAVVAALATIVSMPFVPPGIPVVIAAAVTGGWWAWRRRDREVAA
jgi:predicted branched-subunit amino acid permease